MGGGQRGRRRAPGDVLARENRGGRQLALISVFRPPFGSGKTRRTRGGGERDGGIEGDRYGTG